MEELASRSSTGSDALATQARVLKEVSANLVGQLGGLTKRFEDQGTALITASRTFEVSNSKVDTMMEARQARVTKLMETVTTRAAELDRMMNSYSNMLEQSLSQAELRARKVTELLAEDLAEKSQTAIREIDRLRQDAQTHTQKAVAELQANFTSLSDRSRPSFRRCLRNSRTPRGSFAIRLAVLPWTSSWLRTNCSGTPRFCRKRQAERYRYAPRTAGSTFCTRRLVRAGQPTRILQRGFCAGAAGRAPAPRATSSSPAACRGSSAPGAAPAFLRLRPTPFGEAFVVRATASAASPSGARSTRRGSPNPRSSAVLPGRPVSRAS